MLLYVHSFHTLDEHIYNKIESDECQHIHQNNVVYRQEFVEHNVHHDESYLQTENRKKCTMLRESAAQELVVYMTLVCFEKRLSVVQAQENHAHHIKARHYEQREGYEQTVAAERHHVGVVHSELHEQERKHEAQCEATRIAHENLILMVLSAIHIVIEERNDQYWIGPG